MVDKKLLRNIGILTILLIVIGTVGFSETARIEPSEAFYETIMILLSHFDHYGFKDPASRALVVFLVLSSIVVVAYLLKVLADYIVGLGDGLKRHQMRSKVAKMKQHYIVCGLGRVGSQVVEELRDEGATYVALDKDEDKVKRAIAEGHTALLGDSTDEDVLKAVGIERAKGVVATLGDDSANLFVTLACRQLNSDVFIVARVNRDENRQRMERAGADRTALPYQIGAYHMATMLTRPNAVDFLEVLSTNDNSQLHVEEIHIPQRSHLAGKTLNDLYHERVGATILALNAADGMSKVNPSGNETMYAGDRLIVMGTQAQLKQVHELV
ncbi:TrkA family potassium uptake protein [bacterium]|nr:TrkA family potassium uptake protein [bacterium]